MFDITSAETWSAAAAFIAIIKSEFPPLFSFLQKPKLDCEIHPRIAITHTAGNPNVTIFVALNNPGELDIRIKSAKITITKDQDKFDLPAINCFLVDNKTFLFSPFTLRKRQEWKYSILFARHFSRDDSEQHRKLVAEIKNDINAQINVLSPAEKASTSRPPFEATTEHTSDFIEFYQNRFKWFRGDYKLTLSITTNYPNLIIEKNYRFTIFDSETKSLQDFTQDYKIGLGVYYFDSTKQPALIVEMENNDGAADRN